MLPGDPPSPPTIGAARGGGFPSFSGRTRSRVAEAGWRPSGEERGLQRRRLLVLAPGRQALPKVRLKSLKEEMETGRNLASLRKSETFSVTKSAPTRTAFAA